MGFYNHKPHYIYVLKHNSHIVYVGVSVNPSWRYRDHHYDIYSNVYYFGRYLLSLETPLTIEIIDSAPNKLAGHKLERIYIEYYSNKYHLLNDVECCAAIESIIPKIRQIVNSYLLSNQQKIISNTLLEWQNR